MDRSTSPSPIKGRAYLYLILLLIAVAVMLVLRECSLRPQYSDRTRVAGGDTLNVAIEYSPLSLYRYADTLGGFNYDTFRAIAARKGWEVKFHPLSTLSQGLKGLDESKYDVVVADVARTAGMEGRYIFTEPSYLDRLVLVQLRDSATGKAPITSQLQLAHDTIWTAPDSPVATRLENLSREIGDSIYMLTDPDLGAEKLIMLTALGQIPRAVVNKGVAKKMAKDYPSIDYSVEISFTQFQSWVLRRDRKALADSISSALSDFKETPAYRKLVKRYAL